LLAECSPDKIWENISAADIFVFPSHNEGMPNSLLEAMAMGIPAVAFAIPAVRELEAGTGGVALVPPLDSSLLAQAILRLSSEREERKRIGEKGKAIVTDRFMMDKNMAEAVRRISHAAEKAQGISPEGCRAIQSSP
jgi:glycosyltransferase involved in cell wall biosynthesis